MLKYKFINHKGHVIKYSDYRGDFNRSLDITERMHYNSQLHNQALFESGSTRAGEEMFKSQKKYLKEEEHLSRPTEVFFYGLSVLLAIGVGRQISLHGIGVEEIKGILGSGILQSVLLWKNIKTFKLFQNIEKQLVTINTIYEEEKTSKSKKTDLKEMLSNSDSNDIENTNTIKR